MFSEIEKHLEKKQEYSGNIDAEEMYNYLLQQDSIKCCNQKLMFYYAPEGRWILLEEQNEWHVLSLFFNKKIRRSIKPKEVKEILQRLKYTADIQIKIDNLNPYCHLINIKNGVLDYNKRQLLDKSSKFMFTYELNVSYNADVTESDMPNFLQFCSTSLENDSVKIELLLQIIGYLCTTLINAKKCFILLGEPNSGKSLVIHLIEYMIGKDFISNIQLENLGDRFSTAVLSTKFLNTCAELSAHPLKNIETFKLIVGGDTLNGEYKGEPIFQFKNHCKLLYAGNVLPPIKNEDTSTAFIERLVVLRFPRCIPEEDRIYDLDVKLQNEANAIFSFSINSLIKLIEDNYSFATPTDSGNLLQDYSFQQTNINDFINECCECNETLRVHSAKLYQAYKRFCAENAITPISQNLFSQKINSINGVHCGRFRINGSNSARGFYGISLCSNYIQDSEK